VIEVKYIGQKPLPYVLQTPIPLLSRSERTGEVAFNPTAELDDSWAQYLLTECAGAFERVGAPQVSTDQAPRPLCQADIEHILKYVGKRFTGKAAKWQAFAFIKKHQAETILGLRKLQIIDKVVHWELVPIALADVVAEDQTPAWNTGVHKTTHDASIERKQQDSITVATAGVLEPSIP
jgi:hypothetical protein